MVGDGEMRKGGKLLKMHAQRSDGMNVQTELVATTVSVLPKCSRSPRNYPSCARTYPRSF